MGCRRYLEDGQRFETDEEMTSALTRELVESRHTIEEYLGKPGKHLYYPWHCY